MQKTYGNEIGGSEMIVPKRRDPYLVLVNCQSFLSNFFSLSSSQVFFFVNYRQNGLLLVNFIEQYDSIIYQHLNKISIILPLAISQIAHLCNQFIHVCTANLYATF